MATAQDSPRLIRCRKSDKGRSVSPTAGGVLSRFEGFLRLFRPQPPDHAHRKLVPDLAPATLLELLPQPAVDLLVAGSQADGDLFQHLHQRFSCHRAPPPSPQAHGPRSVCCALLVRIPPTRRSYLFLSRLDVAKLQQCR